MTTKAHAAPASLTTEITALMSNVDAALPAGNADLF
jgi:hypothetical protein